MKSEARLALQYRRLLPRLDERGRRERAASETMALGRGALALVHRATGLSRNTIARGIDEIRERERSTDEGAGAGQEPASSVPARRVRRAGGGQKPIPEREPALLGALEALVEPTTRGDPESPLRWTIKSLRVLAEELVAQGHRVSFRTVGTLLKRLGYSLQGNRKTIEGSAHPDRDAQFGYIARQCRRRLRRDTAPVLSVDTKKELVGRYKNVGREWRPGGEPEPVKVHDFAGPLGRVSPYGVHDLGDDSVWVSVGISSDTAEFAGTASTGTGTTRSPHAERDRSAQFIAARFLRRSVASWRFGRHSCPRDRLLARLPLALSWQSGRIPPRDGPARSSISPRSPLTANPHSTNSSYPRRTVTASSPM